MTQSLSNEELASRPVEAEEVIDAFRRGALDAEFIGAKQSTKPLTTDTHIAERRQVGAAMCPSQISFGALAESLPASISIFHGERRVYANAAYELLTGYSRDELYAMSLCDHVHPEHRNFVREYAEARERGEDAPRRYEAKILTKQGETRWIDISVVMVDFQGAPLRLATAVGIMPRKCGEEALCESEQRFRTLAENTKAIPWEVDASTLDFTFIGPQVVEVFGYPRDEWLSHRFWERHLHPDDLTWVLAYCEGHAPVEDDFDLEYRILDAAGKTVWVCDVMHVVRHDGHPAKLTGFLIDISERKRVMAEQERLILELARKNDELERFAYTASHDLRNPLITIRGFVDLLEKDIAAGDTVRIQQDLGHITVAAQKMETLLTSLLELSRVGLVSRPRDEMALAELAHDAAELLAARLAERNVDLCIDELPTVICDAPRMVQVFQNLIDNAVKFMGDQSRPRIEIGSRQDDDMIICYVEDNGVGIEPPSQDAVFALFERLAATVEGSGIGLALVKRIIESHDGRVWIESDGKDQGCRVCFTIAQEPGSPTH